MTRRAGLLAVLGAAVLAAGPAPASAVPRTAAQVQQLADRAGEDPAALRDLRATTVVDGRPVDLRPVLDGAEGADLDARLEALGAGVGATSGPGTGSAAEAARGAAARELQDGAYRPDSQPKPFKGLFEELDDVVDDVVDALDAQLPGGTAVPWVVLALLLVALTAVVGVVLGRRIELAPAGASPVGVRGPTEDPAAMDRDADAAERRGDHAEAVRLRFRAGLLRLDARHRIDLRASSTTGEVRRALRSPRFDRVARTFDEITYGRREAIPDDTAEAREAWPQILAERGR